MKFEHREYFVTGTDTGIGKTYVTVKLMQALKARDKTVLGLKPVASGGREDPNAYLSENSLEIPYEVINPYLFGEPISPHLAARHEDECIPVSDILDALSEGRSQAVDHIFIEGAGGVYAPINDNETMLDLMKALNIPVIFVVGMRLGCLNHAKLTEQALLAADLPVAGWVANTIDRDMLCLEENLETLHHLLQTPMIARI